MRSKYRSMSGAAIRKAEKLMKSEVNLANKINTKKQNVNNWKLNTLIPLEKAMAVHIATMGKVTLKELRPDLTQDIEEYENITKQRMINILLKRT